MPMPRFQVPQGWRFPSTTNIAELCRKLDTEGEPVQIELATKAVAYIASEIIDIRGLPEDEAAERWSSLIRFWTSRQVPPESVRFHGNGLLLQCISLIHECQFALTRRVAARIDLALDIEMKVIFHSDPEDPEWTYVRVLTDRDDLRDLWKRVSGAEDFKWWAGHDPDDLPDGIDTAEWERRETVWNRVLGTAPMRSSSLMWRLSDETYFNLLMKERQTEITPESVAEVVMGWNKPLEYRETVKEFVLRELNGPAFKIKAEKS